jgi:hypothetical protein
MSKSSKVVKNGQKKLSKNCQKMSKYSCQKVVKKLAKFRHTWKKTNARRAAGTVM